MTPDWPLLTIPGCPPSWKNSQQLVQMGKRSGLIRSRRAREWSEMAVLALRSQWQDRKPIEAPVFAVVRVYVPSSLNLLDSDNAIGGPWDMLAEAGILRKMRTVGPREVNRGDWLIRSSRVDMRVDAKGPRVEIALCPLEEWPEKSLDIYVILPVTPQIPPELVEHCKRNGKEGARILERETRRRLDCTRETGLRICKELVKRGHTPLCPATTMGYLPDLGEEVAMRVCIEQVRISGAVLRADLDDPALGVWAASNGGQDEWAEAGRLGLWRFENLEAVPWVK